MKSDTQKPIAKKLVAVKKLPVLPLPREKGVLIMKGFLEFIREQGVIGLAVGFVMGGAVSKVVSSLANDIINPVLGILLGAAGNLSDAKWQVGGAEVAWGKFVSVLIDFAVIALVVYFAVKLLGIDRLDKKKS